jgi:polyribonucleotide nucleotidyltransferase
MDFKVAGTREGITALQLDTKLDGIPAKVLADALAQAKKARFALLDCIDAEISEPRADNGRTPRVESVKIEPSKIGALIGPGGANIRKITEATGANIDVQQDGRVVVGADTGEAVERAVAMVKASTASLEVGTEFSGQVTRIIGRGAFVEMPGGRDGMVPTEKLSTVQVRRPDDLVAVGDVIKVKVDEVDSQGRVNLTALGLNPDHPILSGKEPPRDSTGDVPGGDRGGRDRGGRGGDRDRGGRDRDRGGRGGDRDRDRGGRDRDRGERSSRFSDGDRPERTERSSDRGDRPERAERPERTERTDRPERAERSDRPERSRREDETVPDVPDDFPTRKRDDEMNARFRPRR